MLRAGRKDKRRRENLCKSLHKFAQSMSENFPNFPWHFPQKLSPKRQSNSKKSLHKIYRSIKNITALKIDFSHGISLLRQQEKWKKLNNPKSKKPHIFSSNMKIPIACKLNTLIFPSIIVFLLSFHFHFISKLMFYIKELLLFSVLRLAKS